ncbi:surf-family protein [Moniliophthora roreri]|nr:surf-family protein [Moniliophthora roreri]
MFSLLRSIQLRPHFRPLRPGIFNITRSRFAHTESANVPSIYKHRRDPWISPLMIAVGAIPVFTFALGIWQLGRLKWKINLIDELQEKLELPPLSLPNKINLSVIPEFVWRKVSVKGKWDHEHTMLLSPRVREGVHGAHVVTPLIRENGSTVLVNRGFVSNEFAENMSFPKEEGEFEVLGMLRVSQPRNVFTPDNHPEEGKWYWTDVHGMAEYAGGEKANVQPVFVEQIFGTYYSHFCCYLKAHLPLFLSRWPCRRCGVRNAHLSYVITWYGLSALTTFLYIRLLMKRKNTRARPLPRFT